ncbi:DUF4224 domain-containing protein [Achromobacter anxifer]
MTPSAESLGLQCPPHQRGSDHLHATSPGEYLSASELAALVQCKPNQRKMMERWLTREGWAYVLGKNGVPRVLRAYRDRKLGISDGQQKTRLSSAPNREAFSKLGEDRNSKAVQARRRPAS